MALIFFLVQPTAGGLLDWMEQGPGHLSASHDEQAVPVTST